MTRSLVTRITLVAIIVAVGLGLSLWLDGSRSKALAVLPHDSALGADQNLVYAVRPSSDDGTTAIYVSIDGGVWQPLTGLVPGRATRVATTPASPTLVYAATEQGLFASADAGRTWQPTILDAHTTVTALALDPLVPDLAYVATRERGLLKLTDGGQSLRLLQDPALSGARIEQILINPAESQILYALTDRGLFRSTTAGETWSEPAGLFGDVATISLVPVDPNLLFVGTHDAGLFRSTDAGATWERINNGLGFEPGSSLAITALAQDPARPHLLYAATAYVLGSGERHLTPAAVYVSTDAGDHWARLARLEPAAAPVTLLIPLPVELPTVRVGSAAGLVTYSLDPVAAARVLASSDDPEERRAAARVLSLAATPDQADPLVAHLDDSDPQVGILVAQALGRLPAETVAPGLVARIERNEESLSVRLRLILALGRMRAPAAVPVLQTILLTEPALARPAADALAEIGNQAAWSALIETLGASAESSQRAAGAALLAAGQRSVPALVQALAHPNPTVRARAADALGWLRADSAASALREALSDKNADVRAAAAFALGRLGEHAALGELEMLRENDVSPAVRRAAARAIPAIRSAEPAAPLVPQLPPAPAASPLPALTNDAQSGLDWSRALILLLTAVAALLVLAGAPVRRYLTARPH